VTHPLTATDLHIAELLTGGVSAQRILAIGQYRTAWGPQDVAYVHAYLTVRDAERQAEQAEPRPPVREECGEYRGVSMHKRRGEPVCDPCREAQSAYQQRWYRKAKAS